MGILFKEKMKRTPRAVNKVLAEKVTQFVQEPKSKRAPKKVAPVVVETKKKNVSTKGKKNWRKNIDTTEIDKKEIQDLDKKINEDKVGALKNEDLFTMDVIPNESSKQKFRREFEAKKVKRVKKLSVLEERKMKHMNLEHLAKNEEKLHAPARAYDLWGESNQTESVFKFPVLSKSYGSTTTLNSSAKQNARISYPKIPLPHPGQSYNPDKKDVQKLMEQVVEHNKNINNRKIDEITYENQKDIEAVVLYETSDEESDYDNREITEHNPSNNLAIDDGDRHTKEKRKEKRRRFLHAQKDKELQRQKQKKIAINSSIGLKKVEKGQKKNFKELEEKNLIELNKKKEADRLQKLGLVDDQELLNDFDTNREPVPLRKMRANNQLIADRFSNIIKRNIVGEYASRHKKRNRKLDKIAYKDNNNNDYEIKVDDAAALKIFE